ncbi:MAG TPA: tetratricopeptide repeat protein [Chitinophagales bacterium]|nr:tetratricopeptide repeat protein [Chitinophagales bacterium]
MNNNEGFRKMKKTYLPTFFLGLFLTTSSLQAQNCSQGDANAARNYSLYKEYFKQEAFDRALPFWRESFEKSPGFRKSIFVDGADLYTDLINNTEDAALKEKYIDTLMSIYDKRIQCWGDEGYVLTLKGIDVARFRPNEYPLAKSILEKAINIEQVNSKYYGVSTYFNLLINLKDEPNGVSAEFIKKEYNKLVAICDANIEANNYPQEFAQTKEAMAYNLKEYVLPKRFAEGADWFTLTPEAKVDSVTLWISQDSSVTNLEDILFNISRDADVNESDIRYTIEMKLHENNPTSNRANNLGAHFYKKKKYAEAIPYFQEAIELSTEDKDKANLYLAIGDTYRLMNEFSQAREAARAAIGLDSASGKPYYLIGVLYLSSGKLCGPGTGFDSQRVIWPAFDYFNKAKEIDPSYAEVVDPLMKDYKKYLPTREEISAKGLKVGRTYNVPCWIQETTTIISKD